MTRTDYLRELDGYLKKLPRADYEDAMAYFEEYFDEAGEENVQTVINELGSPKEAANDLLHHLLDSSSPVGSRRERSRKDKVIIALLTLFSAPIAIPIIFAILMTLFAMIVAIIIALLASLAGSFALFVLGVATMADSFHFLATGSAFALGLGGGLSLVGGGIILFVVTVALSKIFAQGIVAIVKWILRKVRRHEN